MDGSIGESHRQHTDSMVDKDDGCESRLNVDATQVMEWMMFGFNNCSITATRQGCSSTRIRDLDSGQQLDFKKPMSYSIEHQVIQPTLVIVDLIA